MAGVIGVIAFADDAKYPAKTVDHEVIGSPAADIFQQSFSGSPQRLVVILFEGRHVTFGGVKNDPGRDRTPRRSLIPLQVPRKSEILPRRAGSGKLVFHAQSVAVEIETLRRLHQPDPERKGGIVSVWQWDELPFGRPGDRPNGRHDGRSA